MPFAYFFTESEGFAGSKKVTQFGAPSHTEPLELLTLLPVFCVCLRPYW